MTLPDGLLRTEMGIFVLRNDTHLSRWVEAAKRLDIDANIFEISSFARYIPEGGVVVDAGACIGDHVVSYSQIVGRLGHVYAFEPHPLAYEALVRNVDRLLNVTTFRMGLSDNAGMLGFKCDANAGASCIAQGQDTSIVAVTMDEFLLPHMRRCDFIHLDAEGMEPKILCGARNLLARFRPVLVVEVCEAHLQRQQSSEAELMRLLDSLRYDVMPVVGHTDPSLRDVLAVPR